MFSVLQWYLDAQTQLKLTYSVTHTHTHTHTHHTHMHTHALTARLAPTLDGLAALLPWQTSDGWRAEKMKGRKERRGECVCVCVRVLEEWKELSAVVLVPGRILHGAKQIISSSAARVISSKQTALLWTGERLEACPVNLSLSSPPPPLSSSISSVCGGRCVYVFVPMSQSSTDFWAYKHCLFALQWMLKSWRQLFDWLIDRNYLATTLIY